MELNLNQKVIDNIGIGLTKYNHIMAAIQNTDVSSDIEFQKRYNGFYRMRQRPAEYYSTYFNFMEKQKNRDLTFEETLRYLHASLGRIEASFSSKLVAELIRINLFGMSLYFRILELRNQQHIRKIELKRLLKFIRV